MDSVNRLISMKMMTDTAKVRVVSSASSTWELTRLWFVQAADSTQFILITPQSVNGTGFRWGPEVRVIKMSVCPTSLSYTSHHELTLVALTGPGAQPG